MSQHKLGEKYLAKAKPLSQVSDIFDVPMLSEALFPGSHCPLFGAILAIKQIKGAAALIVGSDECTYYAKSMAMQSDAFGEQAQFCYSLVLDQSDVSFGCQEKLTQAIQEICAKQKFEVVFVVTTCLVELIGDDLDSVCDQLTDELGIKLPIVHTEHFKCENHLPGLERVLAACVDLMDPVESRSEGKLRLNLIGHRHGEFDQSELAEFLRRAGVEINLVLPSEAELDQIRQAASVDLNLVTSSIGLALAKAMESKFSIPYIYFDRFVSLETIRTTYQALEEQIKAAGGHVEGLDQWLSERQAKLVEREIEIKRKLKGQSFIYGNTPLVPMEFIAYLAELGLRPLLIQLSAWSDADLAYRERILRQADPYTSKSANIAPLQSIYDVLKPNFYFGHEFAERLRKKGITLMALDSLGKYYGYQLADALFDRLEEALAANQELQLSLAGVKNKADGAKLGLEGSSPGGHHQGHPHGLAMEKGSNLAGLTGVRFSSKRKVE